MTSTITSSSNKQLRTRLLRNEALPQNNSGIDREDSAAINIFVWAVFTFVLVLFCMMGKKLISSDDNNDNDNNDTDSNTNTNTNTNSNANDTNADNSSDNVNYKMNPEEEEERKKNIIFKLFRSEHMEKVSTQQARKLPCFYSFEINHERLLYYHTT